MDDDHRELVNRLFAMATARLEDASEIAVAGQSPGLSRTQLADRARRLQAAARDVAALAEAATVVANLGVDRKRPRGR
jgi:hypothetical protein